jgi:tetratricopeptide (TPR) repeat protein
LPESDEAHPDRPELARLQYETRILVFLMTVIQPSPEENGRKSRLMQGWVLLAMCALVIGVYTYLVQPGLPEIRTPNAPDEYYNLLVQGFRAGQLNLKIEVPPGLAQLRDPYDPATQSSHPELWDLSYYKGKLYLYFGVTPALVLFWPYVMLTGQYLPQHDAVLVFCILGSLVTVGMLCAFCRRYFAEVGTAVLAACAVALGFATLVPVMLVRSDVYEVGISCGYAFTMLALAAIWKALHEPERQGRWLAAASLAYGVAVGARPSLLFGAVILLVPVAQAWREPRNMLRLLLASTAPIVLIGLGLVLYNQLRFDSPSEFGLRYQLNCDRQLTRPLFSSRYLWFNLRLYFLQPVRWTSRFPFMKVVSLPRLPVGYVRVESVFGILSNTPLVWLALAAPLAWQRRPKESCLILQEFLAALAMLFGTCVLLLSFYRYSALRYEVDFQPALVLLAVVGVLSLERALRDRPMCRLAARLGWGLLLAVSLVFNLLVSVRGSADVHCDFGDTLDRRGNTQEAVEQYEQALKIRPDYAEAHNGLGVALMQLGNVQQAIDHWERTLQLSPSSDTAHYNLALALEKLGRTTEAISHLEHALQLNPDLTSAHNHLGNDLAQVGRLPEAVQHLELALQFNPDSVDAHYNLGLVLARLGRLPEAIDHWKQTLRLDPNFSEAHYNLGLALEKLARTQEAIQHYEQALRINPDFVAAQQALARVRAGQ